MRPLMTALTISILLSAAPWVSAQSAETPDPSDASTAAAESTAEPTETPATEPTEAPAAEPTEAPATEPTEAPAAKPTETTEAPLANAGYKKGFFIQSSDGLYKLKLNGRVQVRHDLEIPEEGDLGSAFLIPRARLKLGGHAFDKDLSYKFQIDFGKGEEALKDFYVDYKIVSDWLHLRAGQTKRPFSRQQLTSSGKQILGDRAITDKAFGAGRDIGVMLHNGFGKDNAFEYAVGVFNGTGDKGKFSGSADDEGNVTGKFSNVPDMFNPMLVIRAGYNYGELKRYSEGDFEGGDLRFGVAANAQMDFDAADETDGRIDLAVDASLKVSGFSFDTEFFLRTEQDQGADTTAVSVSEESTDTTSTPATPGFGDQSLTAMGVYAQAGYVIAERYLPVIRFERLMPEGDHNDEQVITAGFGAFIFKHNLKLQTEASMITSETYDAAADAAGSTTDWRVRTQLQLAF